MATFSLNMGSNRDQHHHFTHKEVTAQRDYLPCPRPHNQKMSQDSNPDLSAPKFTLFPVVTAPIISSIILTKSCLYLLSPPPCLWIVLFKMAPDSGWGGKRGDQHKKTKVKNIFKGLPSTTAQSSGQGLSSVRIHQSSIPVCICPNWSVQKSLRMWHILKYHLP